MDISLRQMQYFQALAAERHFGRAAKRCHVSQPALSMQVRRMEEMLQVKLFERTANGIALTMPGEEILRRCNEILKAARDLGDYARHAHGTLIGGLRLGVIPTIAPYLLPRALPEIAERFPRLELRLRETQTESLLRELAEGRLDIVLAALPLNAADLEEMPLGEDRFMLAVPAGHRLAGAAQADIGAIDRSRLLLLEEGHCFRDQALSYCAQADPAVIEEFGAASFATILQMVASSYGITLLPEMAVASEAAARAEIAVLPFAAPAPSRTIGLAWRRSSPRKGDFAALGSLLGEVLARP